MEPVKIPEDRKKDLSVYPRKLVQLLKLPFDLSKERLALTAFKMSCLSVQCLSDKWQFNCFTPFLGEKGFVVQLKAPFKPLNIYARKLLTGSVWRDLQHKIVMGNNLEIAI